jgi:hypothetical protein
MGLRIEHHSTGKSRDEHRAHKDKRQSGSKMGTSSTYALARGLPRPAYRQPDEASAAVQGDRPTITPPAVTYSEAVLAA